MSAIDATTLLVAANAVAWVGVALVLVLVR